VGIVEGDSSRNAERGRLVIRAPNHLGDLVLALPALSQSRPDAIVVRRPLIPLLEMTGLPGRIIPLDRGLGNFMGTVSSLRAERFDRGVLLTPSLSSAALFRMGAVQNRRGTATDSRSLLLSDAVDPAPLATMHRASSYLALVGTPQETEPPVPKLPVPADAQERWRHLAGTTRPMVGIFPGSNASSRRWAPERFGEVSRRLGAAGMSVVIFGGPGETALTAAAAQAGAIDLGAKTDLTTLAAGLAACRLLLTNDSGPMHLAAAVGTPTVSLWGAGNPAETGPLGKGHTLLRHPELPCVPCRMNSCPRRGSGTLLPEAERECMALITVDEVIAAVATYH
jgi:heptosyltransferase-2